MKQYFKLDSVDPDKVITITPKKRRGRRRKKDITTLEEATQYITKVYAFWFEFTKRHRLLNQALKIALEALKSAYPEL